MTERVAMTIRLPEELKEQLQRKADEMGISINALMILLLRTGLKA